MHIQEQVRIVIPVYKEPTSFESISFRQCLEVLSGYPVTLICSDLFNADKYQSIAGEYSRQLEIETFDPYFFESISGYNKLMLNVDFYRRFSKSEYILIYQTDCFVFKDELKEWCSKNYDYIGAPWPFDTSIWVGRHYPWLVRKYYRTIGKHRVPRVGNGGFSLRKTDIFIRNLSIFSYWVNKWNYNEDIFISHCLSFLNPFFKIPFCRQASHFSFDISPEKYHKQNNASLPFGCHGWYRDTDEYKGNKVFYAPLIRSFGYKVDVDQ